MYNHRLSQTIKKLKELKLDALLISNFYNISYLSDFKTLSPDEREAFLLLTFNSIYLFTDARYIENIDHLKVNGCQLKLLTPKEGLIYHLKKIIIKEKLKALGFESEDLKYQEFNILQKNLNEIDFIPTTKVILKIREIKDNIELDKIKRACEIGDSCLSDISRAIKKGMSEKEIAFKLEFWLKEKGYDLAFDSIVAFDKNSAIPHYNTKTGNGRVKEGSVILIDYGVKYEEYLSDITRIFVYGKPNDQVINIYNILLDAQNRTINSIAKLKYLSKIDDFCRQMIVDNHLPSYSHSTGHGVGLEIHEYPKVSFNSEDKLIKNQAFTIEPGVYLSGKFGMRVEDTVFIDNDLKPNVITKFNKTLQIINR